MDQRFEALRDRLSAYQAVAVAFSGGADSTLLLAAARDTLGADHVIAITAVTPYMVREEIGDAIGIAAELGVRNHAAGKCVAGLVDGDGQLVVHLGDLLLAQLGVLLRQAGRVVAGDWGIDKGVRGAGASGGLKLVGLQATGGEYGAAQYADGEFSG